MVCRARPWNLGFTLVALAAVSPWAHASAPLTAAEVSHYECRDRDGKVYVLRQQLGEKYRAFFVSCTAVAAAAPAFEPLPVEPEARAAAPAALPVAASGIAFPKERMRPGPGRTTQARREALLPLIRKVADEYRIDEQLLAAIVHVESRFTRNAVSPKGALGLMQIMPDTGRRYGVSDSSRLLTDAHANLRVGAQYLRDLFQLFGDRVELVLAAYNAGEAAVRRHDYKVPPYRETQDYVASVLKAYGSKTCVEVGCVSVRKTAGR